MIDTFKGGDLVRLTLRQLEQIPSSELNPEEALIAQEAAEPPTEDEVRRVAEWVSAGVGDLAATAYRLKSVGRAARAHHIHVKKARRLVEDVAFFALGDDTLPEIARVLHALQAVVATTD
jgi:hypothetical protein